MHHIGYIHSIESLGTLDGPGLRYVLFLQGCPLRCAYCHNPDTWSLYRGRRVTVTEILTDIKQYLPYFAGGRGGVTVSGGEPLLQAPFLTQLFQALKKLDIHTALDTSGYVDVEKVENLLCYTDLVLLSIKHSDPLKHQLLTEHLPYKPLRLARYLTRIGKPVWIRYVLVPGLTDAEADITALAELVNSMPNVERLEVLPYHDLGVRKWEELGLEYRLGEILPPEEAYTEKTRNFLRTLVSPTVKVS